MKAPPYERTSTIKLRQGQNWKINSDLSTMVIITESKTSYHRS